MAENIRGIREVLQELFKGNDAALEKYAKVRHVQYEMNLWRRYAGLTLNEVPKGVKAYFSRRFLGGKKITEVPKTELDKGFERLDHAVNDGCRLRCERLVSELNLYLENLGLQTVSKPDKFLDWLTFDYMVRQDHEGNPVTEKPYGFEIRIFGDVSNRREFWREIQSLLRANRMMSMQDIAKLVLMKRRNSVILRD